jgi:hypothetical protein
MLDAGSNGIVAPHLYDAVTAEVARADPRPSGISEVVDYGWDGHQPAGAGSLGVTVPGPYWTLNSRAPGMRIVVDASTTGCFGAWRVSARPTAGFDGSQDPGDWTLLGEGNAVEPTPAVVVGGLPEGDWMVHIYLDQNVGELIARWSDSYARVVVGGRAAVAPPQVPAPSPAADCAGQALASGRAVPAVALSVAGPPGMEVLGTPSTHGVAGEVDTFPTDVVAMEAGSVFTVRPTNGTCGNNWSGLFFMAAPDAPVTPLAPLAGLPSNDGSDPNVDTPQLVGAVSGLAPAHGEWLIGIMFWFGGPDAVQYFWRVSVT